MRLRERVPVVTPLDAYDGRFGRTWGPVRQIIHHGDDFDEMHWMPGMVWGKQRAAADQGPFAKLDDGTIVFGLTVVRSGSEGRGDVNESRGKPFAILRVGDGAGERPTRDERATGE